MQCQKLNLGLLSSSNLARCGSFAPHTHTQKKTIGSSQPTQLILSSYLYHTSHPTPYHTQHTIHTISHTPHHATHTPHHVPHISYFMPYTTHLILCASHITNHIDTMPTENLLIALPSCPWRSISTGQVTRGTLRSPPTGALNLWNRHPSDESGPQERRSLKV